MPTRQKHDIASPSHACEITENCSMRQAPLAVAVLLFFSATAPAVAGYGAIAWDKETGKSGWSWDQPTAAKARTVALSECGTSGCKVVMESAAKQCSAMATTEDRKHIGAAWRTTQDA